MVRLLKHTLIFVVLLFVQLHNVKSEEALYSEATIFAQKDNFVIHTIQKGETLFSLQRKYGVEVDSILSANPGLTVKTFYADRKIRIPINPDAVPVVQETKVDTVKQTEIRTEIKKVEQIPLTAIPTINSEGAKAPEHQVISETKIPTESSSVSKSKVTAVPVATEDTTTIKTPIVSENKTATAEPTIVIKNKITETPVVTEDTTTTNIITTDTLVVSDNKTKIETPVVSENKTITVETPVVSENKTATVETPVVTKNKEPEVPVVTENKTVTTGLPNISETKTIAEPIVVTENTTTNFLQNSNLNIVRFDIDLFRYLNQQLSLNSLTTEHKFFLRVYGEQVIGIGKLDSEEFYKKLDNFFTEPTLMSLYEDEQFRFKDLKFIENELSPALEALYLEFPMLIRPTVYAHVSGLNQNVVVTDDILSISLDKYMGANYSFYKRYFYDYQLQRMTPNRIVPDYILGYLMANFPFHGNEDVLLNRMIYEGKLRYVLTRLLPHRTVWDCLSYTEDQHSWCEKNHSQIWKSILKNDHLNVPDYMTTAKYLNNASHTVTISTESPGSIGVWIGFQIVDAYMKNNPGTTLSRLMNLPNTQQFLKDSKYKP